MEVKLLRPTVQLKQYTLADSTDYKKDDGTATKCICTSVTVRETYVTILKIKEIYFEYSYKNENYVKKKNIIFVKTSELNIMFRKNWKISISLEQLLGI